MGMFAILSRVVPQTPRRVGDTEKEVNHQNQIKWIYKESGVIGRIEMVQK